ncbi:MAG: cytochrome family [Solirubrobacterales bacterium]|nr:cytochrome family [Solirubrobacterales bacterium]
MEQADVATVPAVEVADVASRVEAAPEGAEALLPPGPRAPAVAQGMSWYANPVAFMTRCRKRYGRVFHARLGPGQDVVFVSDPGLAQGVFAGDSELFRTGDINGIFKRLIGPNSILLLDGEEHLRRRRILLPAFHGPNLERMRSVMESVIAEEVQRWPTGEPFAVLPKVSDISTEIVVRAIFGVRGRERVADLRAVLPRFMDLCRTSAVFFPPLRRELRGHSPWGRLMRSLKDLDRILYDEIARRRLEPDLDERGDVLSALITTRDDDGTGLSDAEIRDELVTLLVAGHETTAGSLAFAFEQLVHYPHGLDRVEAEVALGGDEYLTALVEESLRRRPVLPIVGRKTTAPVALDDYVLPRGTVILPCVYLMHHEPELYPQPEEFRPERFLDGQTSTYEWIPFGGGIRRCVGASFAMMEMKLVFAAVFSRLSLRAAGLPEAPVRRSVSLAPKDGAMVIAEPLHGGFAR